MDYEWDETKAARNLAWHGVSFEAAVRFEWQSARIRQDTRRDYGEPRFIAYGYIGNRLHCLVFTPRRSSIRIISLRKANRREISRYEKTGTAH